MNRSVSFNHLLPPVNKGSKLIHPFILSINNNVFARGPRRVPGVQLHSWMDFRSLTLKLNSAFPPPVRSLLSLSPPHLAAIHPQSATPQTPGAIFTPCSPSLPIMQAMAKPSRFDFLIILKSILRSALSLPSFQPSWLSLAWVIASNYIVVSPTQVLLAQYPPFL